MVKINLKPKKLKTGKKSSKWKFFDCTFLRSEQMELVEIYIFTEIQYSFISIMGEDELVEFLDSNTHILPHQRKFHRQLTECDQLENQIVFLMKCMREHFIFTPPYFDNPYVPRERELVERMDPRTSEFSYLRKIANEVNEVSENLEKLKGNLEKNMEFKQILVRLLKLFYIATGRRHPVFDTGESDYTTELGTRVYGGIIQRDRLLSLETLLMRCCHGNYILHIDELTEPISDLHDVRRKCIFIVMCQGSKTEQKIIIVAKALKASIYQAGDNKITCEKLLKECDDYINETIKILETTDQHLKLILQTAAPRVSYWYMQILKMKSIYHALNMFSVQSEKFLVAKCWTPSNNLPTIYHILEDLMERNNSVGKPIINKLKITEEPPTCIKLNKFTSAFQNIIHAYGIAKYKEMNPMPYTVITFPFLFGVMFGDFGHGMIMTFFASLMCGFEKKLMRLNINNEMWQIMFEGRYIILLMGLFAIYSGFIYNDLFSVSVNLFETSWSVSYNESTVSDNPLLQLNPNKDYAGVPYPYGMDPVWVLSTNQIDFLNSFKMKLSIILGISQMYFGILLSLTNYLYFNNKISIYAEFIPQMLFFTGLFGYLMFLCFFKWFSYGPNKGMQREAGCAPSILITFINMILMKNTDVSKGCDPEMYSGQKLLEKCFFAVSMTCVPWMLLMKPLYLLCKGKREAKEAERRGERLSRSDEANYIDKFHKFLRHHLRLPSPIRSEEDEGFFSLIIHQCIHTIEFVLGSVSYTASYLRLWALSLAHSQLSEVLWERVFLMGYQHGMGTASCIVCFLAFYVWAFLTVAILVLMEGLSAFLHALRLHWMEFQSKFYLGTGYSYAPFTFKPIQKWVNIRTKT